MQPSDKYLVIKKLDFNTWLNEFSKNKIFQMSVESLLALEIPDACVLRCQDIFVPPALDAYVSGIHIALSLSPLGVVTSEHLALESIADYFHTRSEEAWHMHRRLPT